LDPQIVDAFRNIIYSYFKKNGRKFPFRENITPYNVLVSEIMLQQTQTGAVSEKFLRFINLFPDFNSLNQAPLEDVLKAWHGLGYNRRAIALKKIAEKVIKDYNGVLPDSLKTLEDLPQIGHNTASSTITFAFNKPTVFIETNIRRVFIYFFFQKKNVKDKEIIPLVEKVLDKENPRKWYYALMDYGVMLKKTHPELNKRSAHYKKQAVFKGSNREIRGNILKLLLDRGEILEKELIEKFKIEYERLNKILNQLTKEGFITRNNDLIKFSK
jgi:A/G-specific adenine glycosylase